MPQVEITSGKTGKKFTLDFQNDPTQEDVDDALAQIEPAAIRSDVTFDPRSGRTPEQEVAAQQFIRSEQRPGLQQALEGVLGVGGALVRPLVGIAKGIPAISEVVDDPARLIPTAAEASRRLGIDIVNLGRTAARQVPNLLSQGPVGALMQQLKGLAPRTPSESEVEQFLSEAPFEESLARERQEVAFSGAQPELAEAITQVIELAPPIKGIRSIGGVSVAKAAPERLLRAATKPAKQFGSRFETATKNTISDIFYENPVADTVGAIPFEGFHQTVGIVKKRVGEEIDAGLRQSGIPIAGGDLIAQKLTERANKLEQAGQSAATVKTLTDRASDFIGKVNDMESLREATTSANRANSPLFQKTREAANPILAQADTIANEIIAKTGGEIENRALASVRGPQGANLRKKWSDLALIEQQASNRLNKLINDAPPAAQSIIVDVLSSQAGIGSSIGLAFGKLGAAVPLIAQVAKSYSKKVQKELKDSNALIRSAYDKLRANPPGAPSVLPPSLPSSISPSPTIPVAAITPSLESRIQAVIRDLPKQFRDNPDLARKIAEASIQQFPP